MAQGSCALEWVSGGGDTEELLGDTDVFPTSGSRTRCRLSSCCGRSTSLLDEVAPGRSRVTASSSMLDGVADAGRSLGTACSVWAIGTSGDLRREERIFT